MEYTKEWLTLEGQVDRLIGRGLDVEDRNRAITTLASIGYYRLTGYLYPYLESEQNTDDEGREQTRVLNRYRPGTALSHAEAIIDFDRKLRLLVLEGVERIEVAVRMRIGYILGRTSAFAHEQAACFDESFTRPVTDSRVPKPSKHVQWLERVKARRDGSDEQFVVHFRDKYEDRMPIWALTELLELAPSRPKSGTVELLDHLSAPGAPKADFGTYNALAIIAYLLRSIEPQPSWVQKQADLLRAFPTSHALTLQAMGVPEDWETLELWRGCAEPANAARHG